MGDVIHYKSVDHFDDDKFNAIILCSYHQLYGGKDGYNDFALYIPKWLNPKAKIESDFMAWASPRELTFIRKLNEEEKVGFVNYLLSHLTLLS